MAALTPRGIILGVALWGWALWGCPRQQCGEGQVLDGDHCVAACNSDAQCTSLEVCTQGRCMPRGTASSSGGAVSGSNTTSRVTGSSATASSAASVSSRGSSAVGSGSTAGTSATSAGSTGSSVLPGDSSNPTPGSSSVAGNSSAASSSTASSGVASSSAAVSSVGQSTSVPAGSSSMPPALVLSTLTPNRVLAAGGELPLTLTGSGFVTGMVAVVGGTAQTLATVVTGPGTATFSLGAAYTLAAGTLDLHVEDPGTGRVSNTVPLQVDATPASQLNLLSDGFQASGYSSQVILANPARHAVTVNLRYLPTVSSSATPHTTQVTVPAQALRAVDLADTSNGTALTQCGVEVTSTTPVLAALWMSNPANTRVQSYEAQRAASTRGILGLGFQGTSSTSYIELANPGAQDANISLTAYPDNGAAPVTQTLTLFASRSMTHSFSGMLDYITVEVSSDRPVVAQQSVSGSAIRTFGASGSVPAGEPTLVAPFLQIGTADFTRLAFYNPQTTAQAAVLTLFANGAQSETTLNAGPNRTPQFAPDSTNTPWGNGTTLCAVVEAVELVGTLVTAPPDLGAGDRGRMILPPPATTMVAGAFRVDGGWDARLAVCNPAAGPMEVAVQFLSSQGVSQVARTVPAYSVLVLDSSSSVDGFPTPGNGWVGAVVMTNVPTGAAVVNNGPNGERVLVAAQVANGP